MKPVLLVVVLALGLAGLTGCSSSASTQPSAESGGAAPQDSGAGAKKSPRIPAPAAPK